MTDEKQQYSEGEGAVDISSVTEDAEKEEWATETVSRFNFRDEKDWLEPFTTDAPSLLPQLNFFSGSKNQSVNLTRERFEKRLESCLKKLRKQQKSHLPAEIVDELFRMAISDRQNLSAYADFQRTLKSAEFNRVFKFIRQEKERIGQVSKLLKQPLETLLPVELSGWQGVWIGSLRELVETINAQLISGEEYMQQLQKIGLKSGRTQMESHLLEVALSRINKLVKGRKPDIGSMTLLIAYAHASQLVTYKNTDAVDAMKKRMKRAKRANRKVDREKANRKAAMLGLLLCQMTIGR